MRPSVSAIVKAVCEDAGLEPSAIASGRRTRPIARARHRAAFLAEGIRRDLSLGVLARLIGAGDHSSIIWASARVTARLAAQDLEEQGAIERCLNALSVHDLPHVPRKAARP